MTGFRIKIFLYLGDLQDLSVNFSGDSRDLKSSFFVSAPFNHLGGVEFIYV
jgi:hypothetical protein